MSKELFKKLATSHSYLFYEGGKVQGHIGDFPISLSMINGVMLLTIMVLYYSLVYGRSRTLIAHNKVNYPIFHKIVHFTMFINLSLKIM